MASPSTVSIPTTTKVIRLQNSITKEPDLSLGNPNSTFVLDQEPIPELQDSQILVQSVFISNDPAQRIYIQKDANADRAYAPPVKEGEAMRAWGISKVLKAGSTSSVKEGSLVFVTAGWREYAVLEAKSARPVQPIPGYSPSIFIGALGGPGLTAYFGLHDVLQLRKGQSIVVSGAAGAVGNIVVQYAKHVIGAKVIAIAGSKDKCEWLKKIGADVAVNYKDESFYKDLDEATEGYVDAYFDNVGGAILDHMLTRVKRFGRIAACGAISIYNNPSSTALKNYAEIITNRLTIRGFVIIDYYDRILEGTNALGEALQEGKLTVEGAETLEEVTFEEIPQVWGKLFVGANTGKSVTKIANL